MTCGSEIGNADKYNRDLCAEKGLACMGTAQIVMPENYIAMFSAPQADEARQIVVKAEPDIDRAIAGIQADQPFAPTRNNLYDRFMSGPVNPIFYKFFVKANAFTAVSYTHLLDVTAFAGFLMPAARNCLQTGANRSACATP